METILITLTKSARLVWVEVNLFGEVVKAVLNQGPEERELLEKLVDRVLDEKGFDDYVIHSTSPVSENQYACTVGKVAS